jgi:outer membrane protein assembly factor BamB
MRKSLMIVAVATVLLLVVGAVVFEYTSIQSSAYANPTKNIVGAQTIPANTSSVSSNRSLLQYEWPQFQGDASFTRFSAGPAPEAPDILWKTNIASIQSYISAFDGMVFVTNSTEVFALDEETGNIIWSTKMPAPGPWPTVYKIDDVHMIVGNSCLDPETGRILWTSANFSADRDPFFTDNVYSPEEKMFYTWEHSYVQAWNFSDPSILPTPAWATYIPGGGLVGSGIQYGEGKVFPGSYHCHQMALDAKTGKVLWDTETKSPMLFNGAYYEGKFIRGATKDNTLYCFNANTGEILWAFTPNTDGYFSVGPAVAYGMVYELNTDGYLYALNVKTGNLVWKYKGPSTLIFPGTPTVADGKIYATTGQVSSYTGEEGESEFACLDAYTGTLIWELPIEAFAPRESVAIAYGNLYLIPGYVTTMVDSVNGSEYSTVNQVWAIGTQNWPMFRHDPAHSGIGQSGPTNLNLDWKFTTSGAVVSSPTVADGLVYFGSQDKSIYCVDARNGVLIWKFKENDYIESSPAVVNGRLYTGADDRYVYCLDAYNGSLIWKTCVDGDIPVSFGSSVQLRSSPTVVNGYVYVGSLDNKTYTLDANNGSIVWAFQTQGPITSSPAVVDGAVYITSQEPASGALYKLDANSGSLLWKQTLPYYSSGFGGTDMMASPTVADGMVFVSSNTQAHYGINAATGEIKWTYRDSAAIEFIVSSTIYIDGKLFLIDKFSIVCINATNGHPIWGTYLGEELYVSPSYADGKLYVVTDQRFIYVLNATNGEKLGYFGTDSNSFSSPTIYEGRVYVGCNDWNLYCLAEYSRITSNVTIELTKSKVVLGESVTGFGQLAPGMANESIIVTFIKPDGTTNQIQVTTFENGVFNFAYTPDMVGNWTITASWQSNKGYYTSAYSENSPLMVESKPIEYIYAIIVVVGIAIVTSIGIDIAINKKNLKRRTRIQTSSSQFR